MFHFPVISNVCGEVALRGVRQQFCVVKSTLRCRPWMKVLVNMGIIRYPEGKNYDHERAHASIGKAVPGCASIRNRVVELDEDW